MMEWKRERELKNAVRQGERDAFIERMPVAPDVAFVLFDKVDEALEADTCHDDARHTFAACEQLGLVPDEILPWLRDHGGACDCEVLANVEQKVEEATGVSR